MRFNKILGSCSPSIISEAEEKLTIIMRELCLHYTTKVYASKLGGDILLYQLVYPFPHICDARSIELKNEKKLIEQKYKNGFFSSLEKEASIIEVKKRLGKNILYTAATNGKLYMWNPAFLNKHSLVGLRLIVGHEGYHSVFMHPSRRGSRVASFWNIAVDFKVNYMLLDDLRLRGFYNYEEIFRNELGDFVKLEEYAAFLRDPYNPPPKLAHWNPIHSLKAMIDPAYQVVDKPLYFAEPNLPQELKKPESIYDYLYAQIPKCKCCGKVGHYKKSDEAKQLIEQIKSNDAKNK